MAVNVALLPPCSTVGQPAPRLQLPSDPRQPLPQRLALTLQSIVGEGEGGRLRHRVEHDRSLFTDERNELQTTCLEI